MRGDGLCCETPQERGARMMREAGYAGGGSVSVPMKSAIKRAVREHETQEHGGKHSVIKLQSGGEVPGQRSRSRPDRKAKAVIVNVNVERGGDDEAAKQMAAQRGMQMGAQMAARAAAARMAGPPGAPPGMPPGGPPGMGAPPMMRPPLVPPQAAARGGQIKVRAHSRRKAGGAIA